MPYATADTLRPRRKAFNRTNCNPAGRPAQRGNPIAERIHQRLRQIGRSRNWLVHQLQPGVSQWVFRRWMRTDRVTAWPACVIGFIAVALRCDPMYLLCHSPHPDPNSPEAKAANAPHRPAENALAMLEAQTAGEE